MKVQRVTVVEVRYGECELADVLRQLSLLRRTKERRNEACPSAPSTPE